jgi:hypothetical protein
MKKSLSKLAAALVAAALLPWPAHADEWHGHSTMSYVGAAVANPIYFPAKVAFAVVGAVTSGITYVVTLGEPQPTREIWTAAVEGDYVVTPRMIDGREKVDFVGPS